MATQPQLHGRKRRLAEKQTVKSNDDPEGHRVYIPPPLRSSVEGLVALRLDGTTFLVTPSSAEDFRARYVKAAKKGSVTA